jgi:PEP-CTERM motif
MPLAAEATSITCGFGGASSESACVSFDENNGETFFFQPFGSPYSFSLDFATVHDPFLVTVEDEVIPRSTLDGAGQLPAGQGCLPFAGALDDCVVFHVTAPTSGEDTWEGFYKVYIAWDAVLDAQYPGSTVRLDHARSTNLNFVDITIEGSYNTFDPGPPPCIECFFLDASIGGTDDNFTRFVAASTATPVPEPASVALIATGLGTLWYRRRRR